MIKKILLVTPKTLCNFTQNNQSPLKMLLSTITLKNNAYIRNLHNIINNFYNSNIFHLFIQNFVQLLCATKILKNKIAQAKEEFLDSFSRKEVISFEKKFSCGHVKTL